MSKSVRPPPEIIGSIAEKAVKVRAAATGISAQIIQFQEYLAKMPGRVEAFAFGPHPDAAGWGNSGMPPMELGLKLHREGKDWIISCAEYMPGYHDDPDNEMKWEPLASAPLKIKLASVKIFPRLLNAIDESQDSLMEKMAEISRDYEEFAKSLSLPPIESAKSPASSEDYLDGQWQAVLAQLVDCGAVATGLLKACRITKFDGEQAVIRATGTHRTFVSVLERRGLKEQIRSALSKMIGKQIAVRFEVYDPAMPSMPPRIVGGPEKGGN